MATCTTCGQHYFISFLKDFQFLGKKPGGGEADGDSYYWEPLEESQGGNRVVLIDHLVGGSKDEDLDEHNLSSCTLFSNAKKTRAISPVVCPAELSAGALVVTSGSLRVPSGPPTWRTCTF